MRKILIGVFDEAFSLKTVSVRRCVTVENHYRELAPLFVRVIRTDRDEMHPGKPVTAKSWKRNKERGWLRPD
jgi:hypothetical protein